MSDSTGRACPLCNADISHLSYKHRYCDGCKRFRRRVTAGTVRTKACAHCAVEFIYPVARGTDRKYCSKKCTYQARTAIQQRLAASMPRCSVPDCDTKARSRTSPYCERHYCMVRRNGAPVLQIRTPKRVKFVQTGACPVCRQPLQEHSRKGTKYCSGDCRQLADRARRYGLETQELLDLCEEQGDRCAICGLVSKLVMDHDHSTGVARGLLCGNCNAGIGFLQDDPVVVLSALRYLRSHNVVGQPAEQGAATSGLG